MEQRGFVEVEALYKSIMRTKDPHNQVQRSKTDLSGTLGKNTSAERLIKPTLEFVKSVIEISSKVQDSKTYNEAISNLIYGNRWRKVIDKELWNLDFHQT